MISIENYYVAINNSTYETDCEICEAKADNSGSCPLAGRWPFVCPLKLGYYFKKR